MNLSEIHHDPSVCGSAQHPAGCEDHGVTSMFTLVTDVAATPEALFDASLDIGVHLASMADSRERAIAGVTAGQIGLHETVTWRARHFGVWFTMTSEITELDRPFWFVDEQATGPFRVFKHQHEFEATGDGTRMVERSPSSRLSSVRLLSAWCSFRTSGGSSRDATSCSVRRSPGDTESWGRLTQAIGGVGIRATRQRSHGSRPAGRYANTRMGVVVGANER